MVEMLVVLDRNDWLIGSDSCLLIPSTSEFHKPPLRQAMNQPMNGFEIRCLGEIFGAKPHRIPVLSGSPSLPGPPPLPRLGQKPNLAWPMWAFQDVWEKRTSNVDFMRTYGPPNPFGVCNGIPYPMLGFGSGTWKK